MFSLKCYFRITIYFLHFWWVTKLTQTRKNWHTKILLKRIINKCVGWLRKGDVATEKRQLRGALFFSMHHLREELVSKPKSLQLLDKHEHPHNSANFDRHQRSKCPLPLPLGVWVHRLRNLCSTSRAGEQTSNRAKPRTREDMFYEVEIQTNSWYWKTQCLLTLETTGLWFYL